MNISKLIYTFIVIFLNWNITASADYIINGGFETGDFTGWNFNGNTANGVDSYQPHSGNYEAYFGQSAVDGFASLTQDVALTPGGTYILSFWLSAEPFSASPNELKVSFGGTQLLDLVNVGPSPYTEYSYTVTASSSSNLLEFDIINDTSFFLVDDVSILAYSSVPEPTSMIPLGIGMVTLAGYSTYRSKREQWPLRH